MNYTKKTGSFLSSNKENNIAYYIYTPTGIPRGIIQISHGLCEYVEWYEEFIDFLCEKGFVVCGNDHIGHGKSIETEDDLGYFGKSDGHLHLADDLFELNKIMRKTYKRLPYILLGHSMGSFICRDYIVRYPQSIDGVILCGTMGSNKKIGFGIFLTSLLMKAKGSRFRSEYVKYLTFKGYNDRCKGTSPVDWLTHDEEVINKFVTDRLCTFNFTVSGYNDMFRLIKKINTDEWISRTPKSLPILILSGEEDPVGNYTEGVKEFYNRLLDVEINNLSVKLYPKCRHIVLMDTNRSEVYEDILKWADDTINGVIECKML